MTKKLNIIGPYTPEHPGPFCTRNGYPVKIITKTEGSQDFPIIGLVHDASSPSCWHKTGSFYVTLDENDMDLMNAEEVPVAREFWVNEFKDGSIYTYRKEEDAQPRTAPDFIRTIHVREVLPEEKEDTLELARVSGTFGVKPRHDYHGVGLHINGGGE